VAQMATRDGISYMRTTREKTPVLYGPEEKFPIGGSKVVRSSGSDKVAIIAAGITLHEALKAYAAGITLHEALKAYETLKAEGISVRVIDLYSVKPIDAATVKTAAQECGGNLLVVEDHWPEGGLGDAVLAIFADAGSSHPVVKHLAVYEMPGSGKPQEMLEAAKIDAASIVEAVKAL
jgi:transketolase